MLNDTGAKNQCYFIATNCAVYCVKYEMIYFLGSEVLFLKTKV